MKSRKSFPLRIAPVLYEELEAWARQELRSVNGQIEYLLRHAVSRRRRNQDADAGRSPPGAATGPSRGSEQDETL